MSMGQESMATLAVSRRKALAFRQLASHLHGRLPHRRLVDAVFAGLQDSSPRSALLSLHARVHGISSSDWEDPQLVQIWGPRGADYVVSKEDVGVFTLGRLPRSHAGVIEVLSAMRRVSSVLKRSEGRGKTPSNISRRHLQDLRLASITGRLRIRWDASRISWWMVDPPTTELEHARLELARRFLRSQGPSDPESFAWWSGVSLTDAKHTFQLIEDELLPLKLENNLSWIPIRDLQSLQQATAQRTVRLLPPGDPYIVTRDHCFLVPQPCFRDELWPKSVWPGALFANGELIGTWRRREGRVTLRPWGKPSTEIVKAVHREVQAMPVESTRKDAH